MIAQTPRKHNQLTAPQFYKLCETLKKHAKEFNDKRTSNAEALEILATDVGLVVTESNLDSVKEATGVRWRPNRKLSVSTKPNKEQIVQAITNLYVKLGVDLPEGFDR